MVKGWLATQLRLQVEGFNVDPSTLGGADLAEYVRWNSLALTDELHEFLQEVQWKPWANDAGLVRDRDAAVGELVDVLHFLGNLALSMGADDKEMRRRYKQKVAVNLQRQHADGGYDAFKGKCKHCNRDLAEAGTFTRRWEGEEIYTIVTFCLGCHTEIDREVAEYDETKGD